MAKSDLLKEAIADAKAVKETALENAKIALQESFFPRMREMLATELTNELEGDEEEFGDEMSAEAPMGDEAGFGDEEGGFGDEEEGEGVKWIDNDISFSVGGQSFDATVDNPAEPIDGEEGEEGFGDEFGDETEAGAGAPMGDEFPEEEDELNLEAIIRELEGADEVPVAAGQPEDIEGQEDIEVTMGESIDDIIESILSEEYGEMEEELEEGDYGHKDEELDAVKEELEEAYATVTELKSILSEVNLLNAKLLYTNKLFRNFELSEGQKMKVIENFDRAGNTREVKLVFTTLAESFNKPSKKRVVKESVASKPVASTAPKKENTRVLSEGFELADRWKKLAGLL